MRRWSWIYHREHGLISRWLEQIKRLVENDYAAACELVECGRLIKGYSKTRLRGFNQMTRILSQLESGESADATTIKQWREAAMADEQSIAFHKVLPATG